jgi:hypothetical protein
MEQREDKKVNTIIKKPDTFLRSTGREKERRTLPHPKNANSVILLTSSSSIALASIRILPRLCNVGFVAFRRTTLGPTPVVLPSLSKSASDLEPTTSFGTVGDGGKCDASNPPPLLPLGPPSGAGAETPRTGSYVDFGLRFFIPLLDEANPNPDAALRRFVNEADTDSRFFAAVPFAFAFKVAVTLDDDGGGGGGGSGD